MMLWQADPEPNEREEWIRQPVLPPEVAKSLVPHPQIHPHVEELVETKPRNEVDLETVGLQVFVPNVEVSFERGDAPPQRPFRKKGVCRSMCYSDKLLSHVLTLGLAAQCQRDPHHA